MRKKDSQGDRILGGGGDREGSSFSKDSRERLPGEQEQAIVVPIGDSLDLHTFRPGEVKRLLYDYLEAAHHKGLREVLIIHGKGSGALRATVHSILRKHPLVVGLRQPDASRGGWGATLVLLRDDPSR